MMMMMMMMMMVSRRGLARLRIAFEHALAQHQLLDSVNVVVQARAVERGRALVVALDERLRVIVAKYSRVGARHAL